MPSSQIPRPQLTPLFEVPGVTLLLRSAGGQRLMLSPAFLSAAHVRAPAQAHDSLRLVTVLGDRDSRAMEWPAEACCPGPFFTMYMSAEGGIRTCLSPAGTLLLPPRVQLSPALLVDTKVKRSLSNPAPVFAAPGNQSRVVRTQLAAFLDTARGMVAGTWLGLRRTAREALLRRLESSLLALAGRWRAGSTATSSI
jgi:hypothetical protein